MEIEKKYLLNEEQLAKLVGDNPVYELESRYYLVIDGETEIRISHWHGEKNIYAMDRMELAVDNGKFISRKKDRIRFTKEEFDILSSYVSGSQEPVTRLVCKANGNGVKVYQGPHVGLIRVEVELPEEADFDTYVPDFEYICDITATPLGRDVLLAKLSEDEFAQILATLSKK
jgi:CYTH domain-containing protein